MQNLIENKSYSKLDFYTGLGLLTVDQANHSDVTYLERIHLNQAEKYGAYAVYFRRIDDRSIPQAYIYNYSQQQFDAEKEIAELQWELWNANLVPIIYIFSDNKIKIINCLKKPELDINKKPKLFDDLILAQKIDDELKDRFSALRFDEGTFWDYGDNKDILLKSESSYDLLIENIKTIRNEIRNISENQDERNLFDKLLILSLLIKYLEERTESNGESIISEYLQNADYYTDFLNEAEPKELLVFFDKLSKKFNGDAFELSNFEKQLLNDIDSQCLLSFSRIFIKNEDKGQYYLWDLYSFKHLPVELISSIYEIFLKDNGTDKKGAVYTPNILVDLMLDESLPLNQETIENVDPLNYKILDPACGSGIFLVKAFKRLVNIWKIKNNTWIIDNNTLNTILTNIYGVDKEGICLELSAFSLNLAVCDFMKPSEIEKIKFTKLKGIKLIGKDVDNEEKEGFFWSILNDKIPKDFDLVIGNPPFTGQKKEWTISANQIEKLENIKIPNDKLELLFLQQSFKVCKSKGKVSLLCYAPSFLYNFGSKPFRKKLFKDYEIYKLFDFTALRKDLFKDKKPPILLINGINIKPDLDFIEFISIKRTFSSKKKMLF
ncbi:MAG: class I SAM-dependent DNA methyltransferase, partial [Candidatus Zixiibacteriota bacterium]